MGRKLQSKQNPKKRNVKDGNKFQQQKQRELSILVDNLLKLTSVFQASGALTKGWEHHVQIDSIVREIIKLEDSFIKTASNTRQLNVKKYVNWLNDNGAQFEGVEICEFEEYDLGLKAKKNFPEGSLILTVPSKIMMSVKDAEKSDLAEFINVDPLLQNMPNITLALFLLLEKANPNSFWKPYIDILPSKYSTILYYSLDELAELRPSPAFESSLKLYRSITRQYAYFYNKIQSLDTPVLNQIQNIFTFDNYRWAVSTVMTRQNNIQLADSTITAFIPLWDMCNHEHGKITTDFNKELNRGECYALRDFKPDEQIFIFYGPRPNCDLFLHNGFVYKDNQHDSVSLSLGISSSDPLRAARLALLTKLGLAGVTHYSLFRPPSPISAELLAFIRIFNMNKEELEEWSLLNVPGDLVSQEEASAAAVGADLDRRALGYLMTRCTLIRASYKETSLEEPLSVNSKNVKLLKQCEVTIFDGAIRYLKDALDKLPTVEK